MTEKFGRFYYIKLKMWLKNKLLKFKDNEDGKLFTRYLLDKSLYSGNNKTKHSLSRKMG